MELDFRLWAEAAQIAFDSHRPDYIALDTETEGVAYWDPAFCMTAAWINDRPDGPVAVGHYFEFGDPEVEAAARYIIDRSPNLVFHNAKFDMQKLSLAGLFSPGDWDPVHIHDTEALAHLTDEHRPKRLKFLAKELLDEETDEQQVLREAFRKNKLRVSDGFHRLPREVLIPYAIKDAEFTIMLFDLLYPLVLAKDDLFGLYQREQKLTFVLLDMENRGMAVDLDYVEKTSKEYAKEILKTELAIRDITGIEDFNPNSPKQVAEAFLARGVELEGTGKAILNNVDDPLAKEILNLRTLNKMYGTYLKPLLHEQRDGIIHPSFRQHGAKTGRMSSGAAQAD